MGLSTVSAAGWCPLTAADLLLAILGQGPCCIEHPNPFWLKKNKEKGGQAERRGDARAGCCAQPNIWDWGVHRGRGAEPRGVHNDVVYLNIYSKKYKNKHEEDNYSTKPGTCRLT